MWVWSSTPCSYGQLMRGRQYSMNAPNASEYGAQSNTAVSQQHAVDEHVGP